MLLVIQCESIFKYSNTKCLLIFLTNHRLLNRTNEIYEWVIINKEKYIYKAKKNNENTVRNGV